MSRLSLVPPQLIDMPYVGDTRIPPTGQGYADPLALSGDLAAYNADFSSWDGTKDGLEQEHETDTKYDFDNYYPDEEFWGTRRTDASTIQLIRKAINAQGQLVTVGTHSINIVTAINNDQLPSIQTNVACVRLSPTTVAVYYWGSWNSFNCSVVMAFLSLTNGNLSLISYCGANPGPAALGDHPCGDVWMAKISETVALAVGHVPNGGSENAIKMGVATGRVGYGQFVAFTDGSDNFYNSSGLYPGSAPLIVGGGRVFVAANNYSGSTGVRNQTYFRSLDVTGDPVTGGAVSYGTVTSPVVFDHVNAYLQRAYALMSANRVLMFSNRDGTPRIYNVSVGSGGSSIISSVVLTGAPSAYELHAFARVNANEALVVATDNDNAAKATTRRLFFNADGSMTLGPIVKNYLTAPFQIGATNPGGPMLHRGIALPGNRVLMQHKRTATHFTKLLRA